MALITYADYAIAELLDRQGFDDWWESIDPRDQQDIKDSINREIRDAEDGDRRWLNH